MYNTSHNHGGCMWDMAVKWPSLASCRWAVLVAGRIRASPAGGSSAVLYRLGSTIVKQAAGRNTTNLSQYDHKLVPIDAPTQRQSHTTSIVPNGRGVAGPSQRGLVLLTNRIARETTPNFPPAITQNAPSQATFSRTKASPPGAVTSIKPPAKAASHNARISAKCMPRNVPCCPCSLPPGWHPGACAQE